jgi:hypothetical protein
MLTINEARSCAFVQGVDGKLAIQLPEDMIRI